MALPVYATTGQRIGYYSFLTYCGFVFFFLIAPIFVVLPLSFSSSPFFEFTREFMTLDPSGWSLKWYKQMINICKKLIHQYDLIFLSTEERKYQDRNSSTCFEKQRYIE